MSARRPHRMTRIDRATAEQILDGNPVDPQAGPDELVRLLAAAAAPAAPARVGEVVGEAAAVAAFSRAHLGSAVQPRRDLMIKTALAKVLTMKIAAAALAAVTAGGVWVVTGTSALHSLVGSAAHTTASAVSPAPVPSTPIPAAAKTAYGIAALAGACEAYLAAARSSSPQQSKARTAMIMREFGPLIAAAGGSAGKADAYCRGFLRALRHRYPAGLPSHLPTSLPAGLPISLPTSLPTGLPTALPTSLPTPPTKLPTVLPTIASPTGLPIPSPTILPVPRGSGLPIPHPGQ